jgi:hypothetical protein
MRQKFDAMQKSFKGENLRGRGIADGAKLNRARTIFHEEAPGAALKNLRTA